MALPRAGNDPHTPPGKAMISASISCDLSALLNALGQDTLGALKE